MTEVEYYKTLADLRGQQVACLKQGNFPGYAMLVRKESEAAAEFDATEETQSLRERRKQNLVDALTALNRAVEVVIE